MRHPLAEASHTGASSLLSYARGRVISARHTSGPMVMRALSDALGVTPKEGHRPGLMRLRPTAR